MTQPQNIQQDQEAPIRALPCEVVNQFCSAPANYDEPDEPGTRARCYACGSAVCLECSTRRRYLGRVRRICGRCEEERFPDGEARIRLRTYHRAGYPEMTLAAVKAELGGDGEA